jgi:hypothetical protein
VRHPLRPRVEPEHEWRALLGDELGDVREDRGHVNDVTR